MLEYLSVSKRICLYLARKNAQQTIDHLVYEVSLQLLEDEVPAASGSSGGSATGSSGLLHHRAGAPLEFAGVLQQHAGVCVCVQGSQGRHCRHVRGFGNGSHHAHTHSHHATPKLSCKRVNASVKLTCDA